MARMLQIFQVPLDGAAGVDVDGRGCVAAGAAGCRRLAEVEQLLQTSIRPGTGKVRSCEKLETVSRQRLPKQTFTAFVDPVFVAAISTGEAIAVSAVVAKVAELGVVEPAGLPIPW